MLEDRLRAIPFLRDLPSATIERAAACLRPVSVPRDELVFSAGEPADSLFLVERGWLEVTEPGTSRTLASLGPGSVVGELGILLDAPRAASVRAIGEAELWELRRADVEAMVAEDPSLAVALSREIGRRLLAANRVDGVAPRLVVLPAPGVAALAGALVADGVGVSVLELAPLPDQLPPAVERHRGRARERRRRDDARDHTRRGTVGRPGRPAPGSRSGRRDRHARRGVRRRRGRDAPPLGRRRDRAAPAAARVDVSRNPRPHRALGERARRRARALERRQQDRCAHGRAQGAPRGEGADRRGVGYERRVRRRRDRRPRHPRPRDHDVDPADLPRRSAG